MARSSNTCPSLPRGRLRPAPPLGEVRLVAPLASIPVFRPSHGFLVRPRGASRRTSSLQDGLIYPPSAQVRKTSCPSSLTSAPRRSPSTPTAPPIRCRSTRLGTCCTSTTGGAPRGRSRTCPPASTVARPPRPTRRPTTAATRSTSSRRSFPCRVPVTCAAPCSWCATRREPLAATSAMRATRFARESMACRAFRLSTRIPMLTTPRPSRSCCRTIAWALR